MNSRKKVLIAVGGTGGHVFPGYNLANYLSDKFEVELVTDKRGYKYIKQNKNHKISILPSAPIDDKNILSKVFSYIFIFYSFLRSIIFLILKRPKIIFGMGAYASFPICIASKILRIQFIVYENNLVLGKANKYLIPFAKKIFVSYKNLEGIPTQYEKKIYEIGNIIDKKIIDMPKMETNIHKIEKMNILILGGSQAAKIFAEILPKVFQRCSTENIPIKIYQHCLKEQNDELTAFYKNKKIDFELFNFSNNLIDYFIKANLAITRSGSSILAELTNANVPFISVPLPSSADNHQLKNANFYQKKGFGVLIEEKDLNDKLFYFIKSIYENNSLLNNIKLNQRQYSDKNVYTNINKEIKEILNEKN